MKTTISTLILAATLCASGLVMRPARAQYAGISNGAGMMAMMNHNNNSLFYSQQNIMLSDSIKSQTSKSPRPVRRPLKKALTTTTYRESPAVTKRTVTRFTNWVATKTNASDAASIRRDFENDALGNWAKEVAKDGLKRGDVADAMTQYWMVSWQIANRSMSDPTRAQVQGVRRVFASVLSSTPAFAKATNAQRQEMAEGYIYSAILQAGAFVQVFHSGDKALIQKVSDERAASFKQETGFDLRTVRLTNAGFAAKG